MRFIICLLLLLTLPLISGCQKGEITYHIEGTIIDITSKQNVPNTNVKLYQKIYENNVLSDNYTYVGETTTGENGKFFFEIDRIKIYEIKLEIENSDYYFKSSVYSSSDLSSDGVNVFDEKIESKAWLAIILKNPVIGQGEQLNLHKSGFKEDCSECCTNGYQSFRETGDSTFVCAVLGGSEVVLNYGEVNSGSQFNSHITCTPFDTTYFTIQY